MTDKEIMAALQNARIGKGQNTFATIANNNRSLEALNGLQGLTDDQMSKYSGMLKSANIDAGVSGALSGINALTQIGSIASDLSGVKDQTQYINTVNDLSQLGKSGYGSFDQVISDYNNLGNMNAQLKQNNDYDSIRGMSTGQQLGKIGNATATGAMAGMSVAGPVGAAVGAGIGLLASGAGALYGNNAAKLTQGLNTQRAANATAIAQTNMQAGVDALKEKTSKLNYSNRKDDGGQINRKQLSAQEFIDRMLKRPNFSNRQTVSPIVRTHGEGGTIIRIKRT